MPGNEYIFLSYSRRDTSAQQRILAWLRAHGFSVWVDNEGLQVGTPIWEAEIEKAIRGSRAVVVLLSPSASASEWVRRETGYAERNHKRIFPALIAGNDETSVPLRLTNYQRANLLEDEEAGLERLADSLSRYLQGEGGRADAPSTIPAQPSRSKLPATTTSLVGRAREIADIRGYLSGPDIRLVTLVGPPGIGKTRLSIEVARSAMADFPAGVFFVPLAPLADPALIASTVIQVLGYMETGGLPAAEQLVEAIGDKQGLLVLDNCEHLIEGAAALTSALLAACPRLKILGTSRESLRVEGEWLYPVPAFDLPRGPSAIDLQSVSIYPALSLFAERARAVRPDFVLNAANLQAVVAICARLDGLPLAIELIAARMQFMSPQALLKRLSAQFILTADGMRTASERQKTLNQAIHWGYILLSPEEQDLFARLSVFLGPFTLDAAESVCSRAGAGKRVPELVALLADKSLLRRVPESKDSTEPRFDMLGTIREFARERLEQTGEDNEIRSAHLTHYLALAEGAEKELHGANQLEWMGYLEEARDNLRAALGWAIETGQTEAALRMARGLHWFWNVRSDHQEGRQWLERVLELPDTPLHPEEQAEILTQLVLHLFLLGQGVDAETGESRLRRLGEQALAIARPRADRHSEARALFALALDRFVYGDFAAEHALLEESGGLYREVGDEWGYAWTLNAWAVVLFFQDDQAASLSLLENAVARFRAVGEKYYTCVPLRFIGAIEMRQGNLKRAAEALRESLAIAQSFESKYEIAGTLYRWGQAAQYLGSSERTVCLYWAAKSAYDSIAIGAWNQGMDSEFDTDLAPCRAVLGEQAFAEAVERGRAMSIEQAIAYALAEDNFSSA